MTDFQVTKFQDLKHELVDTTSELAAPTAFSATVQPHEIYNTRQAVLKLSPRVHQLVDALSSGDFEEHDPVELVQAYPCRVSQVDVQDAGSPA